MDADLASESESIYPNESGGDRESPPGRGRNDRKLATIRSPVGGPEGVALLVRPLHLVGNRSRSGVSIGTKLVRFQLLTFVRMRLNRVNEVRDKMSQRSVLHDGGTSTLRIWSLVAGASSDASRP